MRVKIEDLHWQDDGHKITFKADSWGGNLRVHEVHCPCQEGSACRMLREWTDAEAWVYETFNELSVVPDPDQFPWILQALVRGFLDAYEDVEERQVATYDGTLVRPLPGEPFHPNECWVRFCAFEQDEFIEEGILSSSGEFIPSPDMPIVWGNDGWSEDAACYIAFPDDPKVKAALLVQSLKGKSGTAVVPAEVILGKADGDVFA